MRAWLGDALGGPTPIPWSGVRRALGAMVIASATLFAALALLRWHTFHNGTFDLAFYARMAWGEAHSDGWNPIVGAHVRGLHLSWILVPLGWIGMVFGQAPTLLVAQALALAATAWPIARIGARHLGRYGALVAALAWLLHPNISHVATNEFHPGSVAALPLAWAIDALDRRSAVGIVLGTLGVLACREDLGLVTMMIGLGAIVLAMRDREAPTSRALVLTGVLVALGSLTYVAFFVGYLHPRYAPEQGSLELHFGRYGSSALGVVTHLITHPGDLVAHLGARHRIWYLPLIAAPFALLPLARPGYLLLALPVLAINVISEFPGTTDLDSHYLTPALPALLTCAIHAAAALPERPILRLAPLLACAALAHLGLGGTPLSLSFCPEEFREDENTRAARRIVAHIPRGASVQAPDALLPHLAERLEVHRAPPPELGTDYVVLDVAHRGRFAQDEDLLRTSEEPLARSWIARPDHALIDAGGDYVLLARGRGAREGIAFERYVVGRADPDAGTRICDCLAIDGARIEAREDDLLLTLDLIARGPCPEDLALRIGEPWRPLRVDLIADGLLSPARFERGDRIRSSHPLARGEVRPGALRVGALRSSGARPDHADPMSVRVDAQFP